MREQKFDPAVIEAEENLLIDFQFLVQETMSALNISRSELAARAGFSKARVTQMLGNDANPTIKSMARLFHALGERVCVSRTPRVNKEVVKIPAAEKAVTQTEEWQWHWAKASRGERRIDDKLVAVVKDTSASNDNYAPRVMYLDAEELSAA